MKTKFLLFMFVLLIASLGFNMYQFGLLKEAKEELEEHNQKNKSAQRTIQELKELNLELSEEISKSKESYKEEPKQEPEKEKEDKDKNDESKENDKKEEKFTEIYTIKEKVSWNDLQFTIESVEVSNEKSNSISAEYLIKNNSNDMYYTYPDQSTIVTSTGLELKASLMNSDFIGGEMYAGMEKRGKVVFEVPLEENIEKIEWFEIVWDSSFDGVADDYTDDEYTNHKVKIELKEKS